MNDEKGMLQGGELEMVTPEMLRREELGLPLLPVPTKEEIEKARELWEKTEPFGSYDRALDKVFAILPGNSSIEDVLPKVALLNEFCALNIRAVLRVAEHVVESGIDEGLREADLGLCDTLSYVCMPSNREYNFYSFATKFLAYSRPEVYPEFDTYAAKVLVYYRDKDDFSRFLIKEMKEYRRYRQIVLDFRRKYGLEEYSLRDIHRFLWMTGRKHFSERREERSGGRRY